jgi:hydrogenase maturation protease
MNLCVMAVGNVLTGDDAIGPSVLETLDATYDFPANVQLFDVGTPGIDLTMFMEPLDALIIVDAIKAQAAPGTVKSYTRTDLLKGALPVVMSPHEPTLREALMRLEMMQAGPKDVTLIGAVPEHFELVKGMSATMKASVPVIIERVLAELARLGVDVKRKAQPRAPNFWWEPAAEGTSQPEAR